MAPVASVYPGVDFPMPGGVFLAYTVRWLTYVSARRMNDGLFQDTALWEKAAHDLIAAGRPFRDLDLVTVGRRLPVFQEWLDHPSFDEYWARFVPSAGQYADITIPVLTITGQYDDDQLGALTYHDQHVAHPAADHRLVIGPWDHRGTRTGARSVGGLTFAEQSTLDLSALQADWFDWVLGRAQRPAFLGGRVVYFHIGEDRWRSGDSIPDGPEGLTLYPDGSSLSRTPPVSRTAELAIDPRKDDHRGYPREDNAVAGDIADLSGLVHTSGPVGEVLDISGRPRVRLAVTADLPDFDLIAELFVLRDQAIWLGEALMRARYHPASPTVELRFPFISLRTGEADRFALVVRPPHHRYQVNQQAGGEVSAETGADAVAGTVCLVQDRSSVWLPVTPR
jgi:predicted acyl esterase